MNCTMPALKRCFEEAGFGDVRTVLGTGNVAFDTRKTTVPALEKKVERAILASLGRPFPTMVRPTDYLHDLLARDPFAGFKLPLAAKRVITFLRRPPDSTVELPVERDGARILTVQGAEAYSAYEPDPGGPVFMSLLDRTFGKDITTRTVATVEKCAKA